MVKIKPLSYYLMKKWMHVNISNDEQDKRMSNQNIMKEQMDNKWSSNNPKTTQKP